MNRKLEQVLGQKYLKCLQSKSEELEQEILIEKWKHPDLSDSSVLERATLNILYGEYKFYKHHYKLKPLTKYIPAVVLEPVIGETVGLFYISSEHCMFKDLTAYERYIVSLLQHNNKKEVCRLLNCSMPYLSKLLDGTKTKILRR